MFRSPRKFELRAPSPQTAVDIFAGHWAADLSSFLPVERTGAADQSRDPRPGWLLERFAGPDGTLAGKRVLELGPLEAIHTHMLETLGAEVTAVEANAEAYLKCLIVKEQLGLKARFLFGDFVEHMKAAGEAYDIIFASGVLYHSTDPAELIRLIAARAPQVFIWTHVYGPGRWRRPKIVKVERDGLTLAYHQRLYRNRGSSTFWGGNRDRAQLLTRDDLLAALKHYGLTGLHIHREDNRGPRHPAIALSAWR